MQVTFFTCLYKCDKFIESYINMFDKLLNFDGHKLLITNIIDSNSDETNFKINNFKSKYHNIKIIYIYKKKDPGLYECWNNMIKVIDTELICNINPDDILDPTFLNLINIFNDKIDLVCCPLKIMNNQNKIIDIWHNKKQYFYTIKKCDTYEDKLNNYLHFIKNSDCKFGIKIINTNYFDIFDMFCFSSKFKSKIGKNDGYRTLNLPGCAPIWRKSLFDKYGGFNECEYYDSADYELWCRFLSKGVKMFCFNKPLVTFRYRNDSVSNNKKDNNVVYKIFDKYHPLKNIIYN